MAASSCPASASASAYAKASRADHGLGCGSRSAGKALQGDHGGIVLAEVPAGAGLDDGQLDAPVSVETLGLGRTYEVDGPLGTTETALAVGHDRQVRLRTRHPPGRPQVAQRLREVSGPVGDDAGGLPYDADASREPARHLGVLVCLIGIILFERALGGDQV